MNENDTDKLDWMYKGANGMVDREEYLLGRSVDKTLEQLNAEEKEKKLGIVPPKNHVEHECIPPSIRDFNKIVQAEQVDLNAKLQEDPLVAIKRREEEARRQFLQNPVQLKKLQEALKAQELKKKKSKHKKLKSSDSDLDAQIAKKLKFLKGHPAGVVKKKKKSKDDALDTILMHKFNELKDKLSQEDLNDILAGKVSDSEDSEKEAKKEKKRKESSDENSDYKRKKSKTNKSKHGREKVKKTSNRRRDGSSRSSSSEDERFYKDTSRRKWDNLRYNRNKNEENYRKARDVRNRRRRSFEREELSRKEGKSRDRASKEECRKKNVKDDESQKKTVVPECDSDLERTILAKLRILRDSAKSHTRPSSSDSESGKRTVPRNKNNATHLNTKNLSDTSNTSDTDRYDSDSDERAPKSTSFGLVKADGTKIALNKKSFDVKKDGKPHKVETATKPERKKVKKLTEEEKEKIRREMMRNAEKRDVERSENLRKYWEEDRREEQNAVKFDKDFMHKQLLKSTKEATVESRIKSNLNNIQRSSRHMDTHFSRR